jgi:hypothetical protein
VNLCVLIKTLIVKITVAHFWRRLVANKLKQEMAGNIVHGMGRLAKKQTPYPPTRPHVNYGMATLNGMKHVFLV